MLQRANHLPFHALLDLDDTLYPESCGLARACRTNIHGKCQWLSSPSVCTKISAVKLKVWTSHEAGALFASLTLAPWFFFCQRCQNVRLNQDRKAGAHLFCVCPDYMVQRLGIPENVVGDLCNELYSKYGTTMAGMKARAFCIGRTFQLCSV
jgi:hypothetical protein